MASYDSTAFLQTAALFNAHTASPISWRRHRLAYKTPGTSLKQTNYTKTIIFKYQHPGNSKVVLNSLGNVYHVQSIYQKRHGLHSRNANTVPHFVSRWTTCTCIHTSHTYIPYIHTVRTYIRTVHTYEHKYIHQYTHTCTVSMYVQEFLYQVKKKFPRMKVTELSLSHGIHKTM